MNALSLVTNGFIVPNGLEIIAQMFPLPPTEGKELLAKALQLPLPKSMTEVQGIFQSDIIIRSALVLAMRDLRNQPWLIDYIFASLPKDDITSMDYGEAGVARAKEWFLNQDIPVLMNYNINEPRFPCITIALQDSSEAEATLGDIHYEPSERVDADWPTIAGPLRPTAYSPSTGLLRLPKDAIADIVLAAGMSIVDRTGKVHVFLEVLDDDLVAIEPGTLADFSSSMIRGARETHIMSMESVVMSESYQIGLWVDGKPEYLTYLYSIVAFILNRYKQWLLEARGFQRSKQQWSSFAMDKRLHPKIIYTRQCTLTGVVRNSWPKNFSPEIQGVALQLDMTTPGAPAETFVNEDGVVGGDENDPWLADKDA